MTERLKKEKKEVNINVVRNTINFFTGKFYPIPCHDFSIKTNWDSGKEYEQ